jgi:hypothetical protein
VLGEEKNFPPEGSPQRRVCDLICAHPGVTVTALGRTGLPDGGTEYALSALFAFDDREVQIMVS